MIWGNKDEYIFYCYYWMLDIINLVLFFLDLIFFFGMFLGFVSVDKFCCGVGFCEGCCGVYEFYFKKLGCENCNNVNVYLFWDLYYFLEMVY